MKTPAILMVLLISCFPLQAQTVEFDSLIRNLNDHPEHDSVRAQLLLDIARKLRRVDPTTAKVYYDSALKTAVIARQGVIQMKAIHGMAICYGIAGDYRSAIESFRNTLDLSDKYAHPGGKADAYNGLGIVYKRLGDYPQSLEYYSRALPIYDSLNDYRGMGAALENMGVLYDLMKDPDKSMAHYERAIALYEKNNDVLLSSFALQNVAVLLVAQEKYDEALTIFQKNVRLYDSLQRHPNSIATMGNIGYILIQQKKIQEARRLLAPLLLRAQAYQLKQEVASITHNLFKIALAENSLDKAQELVTDYQQLARELKSKEYQKTSWSLFSELHEKRGDYSKALAAFKHYKAWGDSVYNEENAKAFKAQEVKVEVLEKNKQLAEQEMRLSFLQDQVKQGIRMKWLLLVASVLLLATVLLLYQRFAVRRRVNELLTAKNEEISRQKLRIEDINYQLENRMLRAQINPHFIFNSLSSIQHFIITDDKQSSLKYLSRFSNLLRHILESSISGNVLMNEEIRLLTMYLELESLRFNGDFSYHIHVDERLDTGSVEIPTMILQPLIENAVLHGLMPSQGDRKLEISFALAGDSLEISIRDNGIGREASRLLQQGTRKASPSRGLDVTRQRIASLRDKYGWEIEMTHHDLVDADMKAMGTLALLKIPAMATHV